MPTFNAIVLLSPYDHIDGALKTLKKVMLKEGTFKEMKKRAYYEKPSARKRRKSAEARKKIRKARIRAARDLVYQEDKKPNHYGGDYVPSPNYRGGKKTA